MAYIEEVRQFLLEAGGWEADEEGRLRRDELICRLNPVLVNSQLLSGYVLTMTASVDGPELEKWKFQRLYSQPILDIPDAWTIRVISLCEKGVENTYVSVQMHVMQGYGTTERLVNKVNKDVTRLTDITANVQEMLNTFLSQAPSEIATGWGPWNQLRALSNSLRSEFSSKPTT